MKRRVIVTTIDSIMAIMRDACKGELPGDAVPVKLMFNPQQKRKVGIMVESGAWTGELPPLEVKFELKRLWGEI